MYAIWFKEGCQTTRIAPSGARILAAIQTAAQVVKHDLVITCGCDSHPESDPHTKGEAFDIRSHDIPPGLKPDVLQAIMRALQNDLVTDPILPKDGGFVTQQFFGWLELAGEPDEHWHIQQRNNTVYP